MPPESCRTCTGPSEPSGTSTYTIGNLYAAALYARAEEAVGGLEDDLAAGDCARLLDWLRANLHARAYLLEPHELIAGVVGEPPGAGPLLTYLEAKYRQT